MTTASMSATSNSPPLGAMNKENDYNKDTEKYATDNELSDTSLDYGKGEDILGQQDIDPALNAKMHIVNNVRDALRPYPRAFRSLFNQRCGADRASYRQLTRLDGPTITGSFLFSQDLGQYGCDIERILTPAVLTATDMLWTL
jgi:hypothetical protein